MFLVKKQVQFQQIQQILQHPKMATNNPESFVLSVFLPINHTCHAWRKALSIKKKIHQFKSGGNNGLQFFQYISKNNQYNSR